MGFSITVEFLRGVYVSGSPDRRDGTEWPPSPARLFGALVAVAEPDDDPALLWLEQQPAPIIRASAESHTYASTSRESYVPLNDGVTAGAYGRHLARKAGALQRWRQVSPAIPLVRFEWPTDAPEEVLAVLDRLAGSVPYLGRSVCAVESVAANGDVSELVGAAEWIPGGLADRVVLGTTRSGYLADLHEAFAQERSAHEVQRRQLAYGVDRIVAPLVRSAHSGDLVVLPFEGRRVGPGQLMIASRALLKAIESHLDGGPLVVRGARRGEDRPAHQVLLLGFPHVGVPHASGLIAGLGLAFPNDIEPFERRAVLRAIVAVEAQGVNAGPLGRLAFSTEPSSLQALDPQRWTRAATTWVSATPMSSDRFVDLAKPTSVQREVERCCADAGLPAPISASVSREPMCEGAQNIAAHQRRRRLDDRPLPSFHARLTFSEPVGGPVVLGNLRRYGLGLFLPEAAVAPHSTAGGTA